MGFMEEKRDENVPVKNRVTESLGRDRQTDSVLAPSNVCPGPMTCRMCNHILECPCTGAHTYFPMLTSRYKLALTCLREGFLFGFLKLYVAWSDIQSVKSWVNSYLLCSLC